MSTAASVSMSPTEGTDRSDECQTGECNASPSLLARSLVSAVVRLIRSDVNGADSGQYECTNVPYHAVKIAMKHEGRTAR